MGLFAISALILDGGNAYLKRRRAQNAADSGALAGAHTYCKTGDAYQATIDAADYVTRNEANLNGAVSVDAGIVSVPTTITFNTFFAHLIGRPSITVEAIAKAGCFVPSGGEGVLPVAWSCRPPIEGAWDSDDCAILYGDPEGDYEHPEQKYIVMDDEKLDEDLECADPDDPVPDPDDPYLVDCDIDNDGINDILRGGERSWLDLDWDASNANEIKDWITGDEEPDLSVHTWLRAGSGAKGSNFGDVEEYKEGDDVIVPVFDEICNDGDPRIGCPSLVGAEGLHHIANYGPDIVDEVRDYGGEDKYFHIISFAVFHIECVSDVPSKHCPLKDAAVAADLYKNNSVKTIEGYFLRGFVPGLSGTVPGEGGVDAGAYVVYLSE